MKCNCGTEFVGAGAEPKIGDKATCPKCGRVEYAVTCDCGYFCWGSPYGGSFGEHSDWEMSQVGGEHCGRGEPGWFPIPDFPPHG